VPSRRPNAALVARGLLDCRVSAARGPEDAHLDPPQAGVQATPATPWKRQLRRALRRPREPFNALSHLFGVVLAVGGGTYLLIASAGAPWRTASFATYALASIALFTASTLLHALPDRPPLGERLRRADHAAIFLLIAGSYTPVMLVTLHEQASAWTWPLFGLVWGLAAAGAVFKLAVFRMPRGLSTALYVALGWLALLALGAIIHAMRPGGVLLLVAGGLLYSLGAVVFALERPDPAPRSFGYHGLWHLFVLAGWSAHFAMMALYVLPL